jgi:adenosylcobinamide-GDP ribazoletransferase
MTTDPIATWLTTTGFIRTQPMRTGPGTSPAVSDPLRLTFGTLTAVRVTPPTSLAAPVPGRAMALAPLAGLVPGISAAAAGWIGLRLGLSTSIIAVLTVGLFALTTRGLHLDGLADTADGLAASYHRERALEVMRRGDTGPTGLAAVVLVLLLQVAALEQVIGAALRQVPDGAAGQLRAMVVVIVVPVAARVAIPAACVRGVPAARSAGPLWRSVWLWRRWPAGSAAGWPDSPAGPVRWQR